MTRLHISKDYFISRVGRPPADDDLERCNCPKAGEIGHSSCGWNIIADLPNFIHAEHEFMRRLGEAAADEDAQR